MGNSEVGHNALGAGRVFAQGAKLVNAALAIGRALPGRGLALEACARVSESGEPLHFLGLLSDGNVHSHIVAPARAARAGRTARASRRCASTRCSTAATWAETALLYVDRLETVARSRIAPRASATTAIASGGGRMKITMDRYDADWPWSSAAGSCTCAARAAVRECGRGRLRCYGTRQPGISDQNLPALRDRRTRGAPVGPIRDGASVILFNFRGDRAIEITRAFEDAQLRRSSTAGLRPGCFYAGMMQYDGDLELPPASWWSPRDRSHPRRAPRANGVTQLACSETQKFGHVTYFWNGNRSGRSTSGSRSTSRSRAT
jgi:2,3-bisphosphoglycerate-independent phosphoglycerate mutase